MTSQQTLEQLIEERTRLAAESDRLNQRLATLAAEIAAHLPPATQQQPQPQTPPRSHR